MGSSAHWRLDAAGRRRRRRLHRLSACCRSTATHACPRHPPTRQAQAQQQQTAGELPLVGPKPQRFTVAEGQIKEVASAAFPALARLGSGAFCMGYKTALVKDDGG